MENRSYYQQKNIEYTKKLREFLAELPSYVTSFFRGIEQRTQARSRLAYANDIRVFFEWITKSNPIYAGKDIKSIPASVLSDMNAFDIEEYMEYLKLRDEGDTEKVNSEVTIKRKMSALRSLFNYLYRNLIIENNAAIQVDMPKLREKAIVRLDVDEVSKFLDVVEYGPQNMSQRKQKFHELNKVRDLAIMTLLLGTGMRVTELVGIDLKDLDFANGRVKVTRKGGYEAYIYFGDEVADALSKYVDERENIKDIKVGHEDALFLSTRKSRITVRSIELMVKEYSSYITTVKKITPHKLRSTYGTSLYQETGDIYLVADVLGHKDVNTTRKHYAALDEERKLKARDIVKLRKE
jgi:site-specific recombinase XerD